jgi:arylsulfatase A-like enzyme
LLAPASLPGGGAIAEEGSRPNVLIIVSDDQRGGMNVMRQTRAYFEAGGTSFPNAIATTPMCCPSRSSILSGQYAHNHGVHRNTDAADLDHSTSLARYLREAGYRTAIFGKYLNEWAKNPPYFDRWAIFPTADFAYYDGTWNVQGKQQKVTQYGSDYIGDLAEAFIRSTSGPWFAVLAPPNPHKPFTPEPEYANATFPKYECPPSVFETDKSDKPPYVQGINMTCRSGKKVRTEQFRTLLSLDDMVAQVGRAVEDTDRSTLVFYLSDNGFMWSEHGLTRKGHPYLESLRVPFYMRWPGHVAANSSDDRLAANIDIAPTIYEATGITPQHDMDGESLLSPSQRDHVLAEFFAERGWPAPTWASYLTWGTQYTEYYDASGEVTFREYYDLNEDPYLLDNLLAKGRATPSAGNPVLLSRQLAADRTCRASTCP